MKSIIIIVYGFDEKNSNNANAICLYESLEILKSYYDIQIVTTTEKYSKIYTKLYKGITIHYIPIKRKYKKLNFSDWNEKASYYIMNLLNDYNIKKIITISFPFLILYTGYKIKKKYPNIDWIIYELDPYAYNQILRFRKLGFIFRYFKENKILKNADKIYLTHELYRQYTVSLYSKYVKKFRDIGIPLLKLKNNNNLKEENKRIYNVAYIGSFYNKVRNPNFLLDIMNIIVSKNPNIYFHIYGSEKSAFKFEFNNNIFFHGRVSKDKINDIIKSIDIFINIGNSIDNQLPSKVLEYIATGKPIINFYSIKTDTSNYYLDKYPLALKIKENNNFKDYIVNEVIDFIINNSGKCIDSKILYKIYKEDTIENTIKRFINYLD